MKWAFSTLNDYGLDPTGEAECWRDYPDHRLQSHWRCQVGEKRYLIHLTPAKNPVNYVTDGWRVRAKATNSPYTLGGYDDDDASDCDPSYPDVCIPADSYDVDCAEVEDTDITVDGDDPYGLDGDGDGVGCESYDDSYYEDSYDESSEYESDESGDLDCSDVSGPVYVPPDDPNGLDGDGDGIGCE